MLSISCTLVSDAFFHSVSTVGLPTLRLLDVSRGEGTAAAADKKKIMSEITMRAVQAELIISRINLTSGDWLAPRSMAARLRSVSSTQVVIYARACIALHHCN